MATSLDAPTPGSPEKEAVRSMFDRIAPRYDLLNHVLSAGVDRRWRRACVEFVGLSTPARLLDLCTGTADLLIEALKHYGQTRGVGVDLSGQMLRRGSHKLQGRGLAGRAALAAADAERLPLADGAFDGVLVAFGIRNVGDPGLALREAHRVLRPGGRLVVLEFALPRGPLGALYRFYFRSVLPRVGRVVSGDRGAYSYLSASVARFLRPPELQALMAASGFRVSGSRPLTGGIAWLYRGEKA